MKKNSLYIFAFLLSFLAFSQDDKQIRKDWEKKKKETDALVFKKLYDDNDSLKSEIGTK